MEKQLLYFDYHPAWLLVCALVGVGYAIALYYKNKNWAVNRKWLLGGLRACTIFLLAALLLNPKSIFTESREENPIVYFVVDNSLSMTSQLDSTAYTQMINRLFKTAESLEERNVDVRLTGLDGKKIDVKSKPNLGYTDLDQSLRSVKEESRGQNIQGVVLVSDGLYNRGVVPGQFSYKFPVFTLGIGDTTALPDIRIDELNYNKIVYAGNAFELQVSIKSEFLRNAINLPLKVSRGGKLIAQKNVSFTTGSQYLRVPFLLEGEATGLVEYTIEIENTSEEKIVENNRSSAYIEFVKSKEVILIAAATPHPDINAIRSALEDKEQLEIEVAIAGIHPLPNKASYDLVILHQLPNISGQAKDWIEKLDHGKQAVWYITGTSSQYNVLFEKDLPAKVRLKSLNPDQAKAEIETNFKSFGINDQFKERFNSYPPLAVPFGEYAVKSDGQVLLKQKIGNSITDRPLFTVSGEYPRKAIWYGEGLWSWRLQEGQEFGNSKGFDGFIQQVVQYLSAREDKRKLRVYAREKEYYGGEPVQLISEVYDDLLNPSFGHDIKLNLKNVSKQITSTYSFEHNAIQQGLVLDNLASGIYEYEASTLLDNKTVNAKGGFIIKEQQMEFSTSTANHRLLMELSNRQNGKYYHADEWEAMDSLLLNRKFATLLHTLDTEKKWVHNGWLLALILTLACLEWTLRKYWGRT